MRTMLDQLLTGGAAPRSLLVLYPWIAVTLTVAVTLLNHRRLRERLGDTAGMWVYFAGFFTFFLLVPVALVLVAEPSPGAVLASLGLGPGRWRLGLVLSAIAVPITLFMSHLSSKMPEMQGQYPFSKAACASDGAFALYEAGYLVLYYTAWEFLYRGLLFFPLVSALGFLPAMAITTALSTVYHIGHPDTEIWSALAGGVVFGLIAWLTGSVYYSFFIHAMLGVSDDAFIYARCYRHRAAR